MASKKYPDCQWELSQIRNFVNDAKEEVGVLGWKFLSKPQREGLIARRVLSVVYGNWRMESGGSLEIRVIRDLHKAMRAEAGLIDEDEE